VVVQVPRMLASLLAAAAILEAHDLITTKLTYTRDVRPILAQHCLACHGSRDAIALTTYQEVRPWAVGIKEQVLQRNMPPFGAVKGFGNLKNDGALSQQDILTLSAWVVGGAPQGDPHYSAAVAGVAEKKVGSRPSESVTVEIGRPLAAPLKVSGLKPIVARRVDSERIIARKPDGEIIPLVWLYQFKPECNNDYQFAEPLSLPAGTVVESSVPLPSTTQSAETGTVKQVVLTVSRR
jgi:mono/diheme cytochrome c family protein